jgi:nucleoside-diphosphate-sugar epimerase
VSVVLVTGGSGFIGVHAILQLLEAGHTVRTTIRSRDKEDTVRQMLAVGGGSPGSNLSLLEADLLRDEGWAEATRGCDFVLHVASPFPPTLPTHEDELIRPAREGTLRVLRAGRDAGVKRVVLTSSFAAIGYGHPPREEPFDETWWTNLDGRAVTPYVKSKTLAERAAWQFVEEQGGGMELSAVNPVAVFGPVLGPKYSTSILLVQRLLEGAVPGFPRLAFGVVDVRDVADLHLRAMVHPAAAGERFLAISGSAMSIGEMAGTLRARLGQAARRVPKRELPDWLIRLVGLVKPEIRAVTPELGRRKDATSAKARQVLGWTPRSREDALVASARSLHDLGLLEGASGDARR